MVAHGFEEHARGGEVALGGDFAADVGVFEIVEVVSIGVEDAVATEAEGLMHLKVETDRSHGAAHCTARAQEVYGWERACMENSEHSLMRGAAEFAG